MVKPKSSPNIPPIVKAKMLEDILENGCKKTILREKYHCSNRTVEYMQQLAATIQDATVEDNYERLMKSGKVYDSLFLVNKLKERAAYLLAVEPEDDSKAGGPVGIFGAASIWDTASRIFQISHKSELELMGVDAASRTAGALEKLSDAALAEELKRLEKLEIKDAEFHELS
jgi:hypothetical protein